MDTKEIITKSMFRMLKEMPFEKITVQTILDECKVSRSTFYKYFRDKYDLMNWCYQSYVDTLIERSENEGWKKMLILDFQFFSDNHEYFEKAAQVQGKNSFLDFLYDYSYNFYKDVYLKNTGEKALSTQARIALEFNCMGAIHVVKLWLLNGRKESGEELAELIFHLIPEMYQKYL